MSLEKAGARVLLIHPRAGATLRLNADIWSDRSGRILHRVAVTEDAELL